MKTNKALRRLTDVEDLLSAVIERYEARDKSVRKLLDEAKACIVEARQTVNKEAESPAKKPPSAKPQKRSRAANTTHLTPMDVSISTAPPNGVSVKGRPKKSVVKPRRRPPSEVQP